MGEGSKPFYVIQNNEFERKGEIERPKKVHINKPICCLDHGEMKSKNNFFEA